MTEQFTANEPFDRLFLLKSIDERLTRNGKPYLALVLGTPSADLEARLWDMDLKSLPGLAEGDPVKARGTSQIYQEKIQLVVDFIEKIRVPVDPREIYPSSVCSEEEYRNEFDALIRGIKDRHLAALMDVMEKDSEIFDAFFISPAAVTMHHARIGGLAEHTLNVCRIVLAVSDIWPRLDRDLLTAGAVLHDIGKIREYQVGGDFSYTLDGKFIGHIVRGVSIVEDWIRKLPAFPERLALDLLHIVLSHHGALEHGSPKAPATAEALVVHYADDLDAKLDMIQTARTGEETQEAYVRGLRRMFQYRETEGAVRRAESEERQGGGPRTEGGGEEKREPGIHPSTGSGQGIQNSEDMRENPIGENEKAVNGESGFENKAADKSKEEDDDQGQLF